MVLNKKEKREKEYLALCKSRAENLQAQLSLGYVQLKEPRPNGWDVILVPRKDIQNREDADMFWKIIRLISRKGHVRVKSWYFSKNKKYLAYPYRPALGEISESTYESLTAAEKKHFSISIKNSSIWRKFYVCDIPNFYWETKLVRNYITKVPVIDVNLLKQESELQNKIYYLEDKFGCGEYHRKNAPKRYRKQFKEGFRAKNKQTLHNIINKGKEAEFDYKEENAAWYYW